MTSRDTRVYVIGHAADGVLIGPVKVGVAASPRSRLVELQTGNPRSLVLCAEFTLPTREIALAVERAFHVVQAPRRLVGEWFAIEPRDAIILMCANVRACMEATSDLSGDALQICLELTGVLDHERRVVLLGEPAGRA